MDTAGVEPNSPAEAVAELLGGLNKGQYLILLEAVRQLGGDLRLDWDRIVAESEMPPVPMIVDPWDGAVILRVPKPGENL